MPDHTILVIDYEPKTVETSRAILEKAGFRVETAADGVAGVEAFHQFKPALTLIEFMLPKKSGLEVCRELRATPDGAEAALVITGSRFRSRQYRNEARHTYKADDFVEKPISEETLLALVDALVTGRELAAATPAAKVTVPPTAATSPAAAPTAPAPASKPHAPATPAATRPAAAPAAPAAPSAKPAPAEAGGEDMESEIGDHLDSLFGDL